MIQEVETHINRYKSVVTTTSTRDTVTDDFARDSPEVNHVTPVRPVVRQPPPHSTVTFAPQHSSTILNPDAARREYTASLPRLLSAIDASLTVTINESDNDRTRTVTRGRGAHTTTYMRNLPPFRITSCS